MHTISDMLCAFKFFSLLHWAEVCVGPAWRTLERIYSNLDLGFRGLPGSLVPRVKVKSRKRGAKGRNLSRGALQFERHSYTAQPKQAMDPGAP